MKNQVDEALSIIRTRLNESKTQLDAKIDWLYKDSKK